MEDITFDSNLICAIFKSVWSERALEREKAEFNDILDSEAGAGSSKKIRSTSANAIALKLSCELLRVFVTEAVQRAAAIAESEGSSQIEATHLESWRWIIKEEQANICRDAANANALKLSSELIRIFVTEAIRRAAAIAESEGSSQIEATLLESILPQLLLDF